MKPVQVIVWAIEQAGEDVHTAADLYCGSGTTIIASEHLGKTCYAMEIDPRYIDITINRWESFTGEKAQMISRRE